MRKVIMKNCVNLKLTEDLIPIVNDAIDKVRNLYPNSKVRENAEFFVNVHIVPIRVLVKYEGGRIESLGYVENVFFLDRNTILNNIMPKINVSPKILSKALKRYKELLSSDMVEHYIGLLMDVLRLFSNYALCDDVLAYLTWAYASIKSPGLSNVKDIANVFKGLLTVFIDSMMKIVSGRTRDVDLITSVFLNLLIKRLRDNEGLLVIRVNEDCAYLSIIGNT